MERTLFDADHELFRESFRTFVAKEMSPHTEEWDAAGIVDRSLFTAAGAHGFLAMAAPEEHGGGGVDDFRYNQIIGEELVYAGVGGAGLCITLHNDVCLPYFLDLTTEAQKAALVARHLLGRAGHRHRHDRTGHRLRPGVACRPAPSATATTTWSTAPRPSSPTASTPTW